MNQQVTPPPTTRSGLKHSILAHIRRTMLTAIVALWALTAWAQGISYQAVLRDANGQIMANQEVKLRLSILNGATPVYQEEQTATTTPQGIINIAIGEGNATGGTFADIDWSQAYDLRVEVDANESGTYAAMPTTPLRPVPQAYHAKWAENLKTSGSKGVTLEAQSTIDDDSLLFGVRNNKGDLVFAVYNNAVAVYVDTTPNGRPTQRAGFAVGGMAGRDGKQGKPLLQVDLSGTTVHVDDGAEATNGGRAVQKASFAVGGMAGPANYFVVTSDSTRVYVDESSRPQRAGFAVGGLDGTRAGDSRYMDITRDNYIIGYGAGTSLMKGATTGKNNSIMGTGAGASITTGQNNVFVGNQAGAANVSGGDNVVMGTNAAQTANNMTRTIAIGNQAGKGTSASTSTDDIFIGYQAGAANTTGSSNVMMGNLAGSKNTSGSSNVFVGNQAGAANTTASDNVFVGNQAGASHTEGYSNIFIGDRAAFKSKKNSSSVFIGIVPNQTDLAFSNDLNSTVSVGNYILYKPEIPVDAKISQCVFIGDMVGGNLYGDCKYVSCNTFIGEQAGRYMHPPSDEAYNDVIAHNIAIGYGSGYNAGGNSSFYLGYMSGRESDGRDNIFFGESTGNNLKGNDNILFGVSSGNNIIGNTNLILGRASGGGIEGNYNIAVGWQTGSQTKGSNNIYIGSNVRGTTSSPFNESNTLRIGGSFKDNYIYATGSIMELKGTVTSNANNTYDLGSSTKRWKTIYAQNTLNTSDRRLKTDIRPLENALAKVLKLNGISYKWRAAEFPKMNFDSKQHVGVIAQEVEAVLPEAVETGEDGYKSVSYNDLVPLLIEAVKEQQQKIEKLEKLVEQLMKK